MVTRQIIKIDDDLCDGCGLCVTACHEGAIQLVDGKARLIRDDYCDGLGDCLPACPTGAITFETRLAAAYDEEAVLKKMAEQKDSQESSKKTPSQDAFTAIPVQTNVAPRGCPGSLARSLGNQTSTTQSSRSTPARDTRQSELRNWPVQLKLAPITASYFNGANLLIAADCAAFASASFHEEFLRGKVAVIGCPKLDEGDYTAKLTEIIKQNDIKSVTIVRMEVPCCGGLAHAGTEALKASGKFIPWQIVTLSVEGEQL